MPTNLSSSTLHVWKHLRLWCSNINNLYCSISTQTRSILAIDTTKHYPNLPHNLYFDVNHIHITHIISLHNTISVIPYNPHKAKNHYYWTIIITTTSFTASTSPLPNSSNIYRLYRHSHSKPTPPTYCNSQFATNVLPYKITIVPSPKEKKRTVTKVI